MTDITPAEHSILLKLRRIALMESELQQIRDTVEELEGRENGLVYKLDLEEKELEELREELHGQD